MASTDLIVPSADSPYAVLRLEQDDAQALIQDALGGESLSFRDLDRIKIPSGGGIAFTIPSLDGDDIAKELVGVIIHKEVRRTYWSRSYDERSEGDDDDTGAPDCQSANGTEGIGTPGGNCATCPLNEWESARNGRGKACRESRQLFLLTEGDLLPITITIPPGSLGAFRDYTLKCLKAQVPMDGLVTRISLEKAVAKDGKTEFSKVQFARAGQLDGEAISRVRAFKDSIMPAIIASAQPRRDEVEAD